jgi:hypothetical protein
MNIVEHVYFLLIGIFGNCLDPVKV